MQAWDRVAIAGVDHIRVLEFSSTQRAFCGFEKQEMEQHFNEAMLGPLGKDSVRQRGALNFVNWCCRNDDPNGYKPVPVDMRMPHAFSGDETCKALKGYSQFIAR